MSTYHDKKKSGTSSFDKEKIMVVRRNSKATDELIKPQPRYRGPVAITEILPSNAYRISQLEPSNGHLYATMALVSQLKAWKSRNEDYDDSSENSDDEPEMQRLKRTMCKQLRYGNFM
ncbi:hypothetical protein AVEN_162297-1 [Araneus ventricosus]|uniref:Uncharacterized protein n=1 Tax=Araneus ventricosus TaxID=182803 RepID=A0A4Y2NCF1_ARAVE|nr:hypothetical protein AVEN_162297-1 [Araneus ventricosus]